MSTQFVSASYQEIIDLHTESDQVSVIGIHTPVGDTPHRMFEGFFKQFKKYRYLGCSISFVPAARLPVDPLQVSYEPGEAQIDPRDMLNPLMFHGCHGEDLGAILNKFYAMGVVGPSSNASIYSMLESDSAFMASEKDTTILQDANMLESLYYKALTDNTWKKAHPQRGFRKAGLRPLVYSMATTHQLMPGTLNTAFGPEGDDLLGLGTTGDYLHLAGIPAEEYATQTQTGKKLTVTNIKKATQFLTPRLTGLGWMDTYNVLSNYAAGYTFTPQTLDAIQTQLNTEAMNPATLPCIFMGVILLPPAYKTEQWFRCIITHHFQWKQFRGISYDPSMSNPAYNDWNTATPLTGPSLGDSSDDPSLGDSSDDPSLGDPDAPTIEDGTVKNFTGSSDEIEVYDDGSWETLTAASNLALAPPSSNRYDYSVERDGDTLKLWATVVGNTVQYYWVPSEQKWYRDYQGQQANTSVSLEWVDPFSDATLSAAIKNGTDLEWYDDGE